MISTFFSKLLMGRQANFTEENISIFDILFFMQPIESLIDLQKSLEVKFGKKGLILMKEFGRDISNDMLKHFKTRFSMKGDQLRNVWLNMFSLSGLGKLEIVEMTETKAIFQISTSSIAKIYLSKHGQQKSSVCVIIEGMLESYFEEVTGKKCNCKETSCVVMGKKYCTFQISV